MHSYFSLTVLFLWCLLLCLLEVNFKTKPLLLCILCALLGCLRQEYFVNSWYAKAQELTKKQITIYGLVTDIIETENALLRLTIYCSYPLSIRNKTIFVYMRGKPFKNPLPGDSIKIVHASPSVPTNKSFALYLMKEEISSTLFIGSRSIFIRNNTSLWAKIVRTRNNLLTSLRAKMNNDTALLFESLFLGNRSNIKNHSFSTLFKQWGMSHYLARSGLHLAVFIFIWSFFVQFVPLGWRLKQLILLLISCIYLLFSWSSISIWRAFGTFALIKAHLIFKKPYDFFHVLTCIWTLLLVINPLYIFFLDFQLTFLLTAALAWFSKLSRTFP
jgi:predicted membrane metal-binding protein